MAWLTRPSRSMARIIFSAPESKPPRVETTMAVAPHSHDQKETHKTDFWLWNDKRKAPDCGQMVQALPSPVLPGTFWMSTVHQIRRINNFNMAAPTLTLIDELVSPNINPNVHSHWQKMRHDATIRLLGPGMTRSRGEVPLNGTRVGRHRYGEFRHTLQM